MKYIIIQAPLGRGMVREIPIIFPDELVHADVADAMRAVIKHGKPVSAGFLNSVDFDGSAHGKSETLNLKSRPEDTTLIRMHDYMKGIKDRD